jgi:hypothetical protein
VEFSPWQLAIHLFAVFDGEPQLKMSKGLCWTRIGFFLGGLVALRALRVEAVDGRREEEEELPAAASALAFCCFFFFVLVLLLLVPPAPTVPAVAAGSPAPGAVLVPAAE